MKIQNLKSKIDSGQARMTSFWGGASRRLRNLKYYFLSFELRASSFHQGFSLVELLVVIGIIAIIMVAIFPNFTGARQRARDNQRKIDLKNLQSALELYKSDQKPPVYVPSPTLPLLCGKCWSSQANCAGNIYMRKVPCDPLGAATPTPYIYVLNSGDNLKYTLSACLENPVDPDKDSSPVTGCTTSYTINEP